MAESTKPGWNGNLILAVVAAGVGSAFQHGYNTAVLSAPVDKIKGFISESKGGNATQHDTTLIFSIIATMFCVGGLIGALSSGILGKMFGRKTCLLYNNILVLVAAALMGFSKMSNSYVMLIVGRLIIGINCGLNAGLAPLYLEEISPVNLRGSIGTVYQLVLTISILIAQILGFEAILGSWDRWPYLFAVLPLGAVLMVATLPFCPESPKFLLLVRQQDAAAQSALSWLRGTNDVQQEMDEMRLDAEKIKQEPRVTWGDMIKNPVFRQPFIIVIIIMLSQQLSGINAVISYSKIVFVSAGLDGVKADFTSVGMGVINVLMTFVSLILVDKAGRRTLLLTGYVGMAITTIVLALTLSLSEEVQFAKYTSIVAVYLFVIMFATGLGSIPWFLVTEMFGMGAKDKAQPVAVGVNWLANIVVTFAYPNLNDLLGPPIFLVFAILLSMFWVYAYKRLPETKGRTVEEVTNIFQR